MPRVIAPRAMTRRELRRLLLGLLDDLDGLCLFWACPGPDKPTVQMATCRVCFVVKRLRVITAWLT